MLTDEKCQTVISAANNLQNTSTPQTQAVLHKQKGIIDMSNIPEPNHHVCKARVTLEEVLMLLSYE